MKRTAKIPSNLVTPTANQLTLAAASVAPIDAIIVPTSRASSCLVASIKLAKETNTQLLVLCSGNASATKAAELMSAANVKGTAITIPERYSHVLLTGLATDTFPEAIHGREQVDTSIKRNLGLLFARLVGWKHIFFLDDDVRGINSKQFTQLAASLRDNTVAGFLAVDFPDNSVVRHAERLSGVSPTVSLSGGALAINTMKAIGFFPNIYNEDWFLVHDNRSTAIALGYVSQETYEPFSNSLRAASEEFGDILAEGIVELAAAGIHCIAATKTDWHALLGQRKRLIGDIRMRLLMQSNIPGNHHHMAAVDALHTAEQRLQAIEATVCHAYIKAWRNDVDTWQDRLDNLTSHLSFTEAIRELGLSEYAIDAC